MPGVGPAVPQQCPETGANFLMGGPFWADPIHNMDWVHGILKSVQVRHPPYSLPPPPLPPPSSLRIHVIVHVPDLLH